MSDRPLRLVRVINNMWTGGVQTRLVQLLPRLRDRGVHVEVCAIRGLGDQAQRLKRDHGIDTVLVPIERRMGPRDLWRLRGYFAAGRFDVVHSHMYQSNAPATVAAVMARTRCIVAQWHNVDMYRRPSQKRLDRWLAPWRDAMVCVSDAVRQNTATHLRLPPARFDVLLNGIDTQPPPTRPRGETRRELGVADDAVVVVHVARLTAQKGQVPFLDHMPRLLRDVPRSRLLIVGEGEDEPRIRARIAELGLGHAVQLLGNRADVPDLLAAADISILPSTKEGFSNVVLESMLHGAALVITDVGGAREQLTDGVDGFIVPAGALGAFADRVVQLARDGDLRQRLATAARRRVDDFGLDAMADQTLALYDRILARRGRR